MPDAKNLERSVHPPVVRHETSATQHGRLLRLVRQSWLTDLDPAVFLELCSSGLAGAAETMSNKLHIDSSSSSFVAP